MTMQTTSRLSRCSGGCERRPRGGAMIRAILLLAFGLWLSCAAAQAQFLAGGEDPAAAVAIPEALTPEIVDGMLARLTDSEIRALLREELRARAEEQAAAAEAESAFQTLAAVEARLVEMATTIDTRVSRWAVALANIADRRERVEARLAQASHGAGGMIAAALALIAAGVGAALAVSLATRRWRRWLTEADRPGYWDRVARTGALAVVEFIPIVVFVAVTRSLAPMMRDALGPLWGQVWIYHAGVSYAWAFILAVRRAFAPDAPSIRIAPLSDEAAESVHRLMRRAVRIGAAGWLVAGLSPNLGFGFPPAMVIVASSGVAVAALLLYTLARSAERVRDAVRAVLGGDEPGAFARIVTAAAPGLLGLYILGASAFWLAHWLETGRHHLHGPAGTLLVLLGMPILDRLGREIVAAVLRGDSEAAERFRGVFRGAWRMLVGLGAALVVLDLWGLDLIALATGPRAPAWADAGLDVLVTLLIGALIWRLIGAALYSEKRVSDASEDIDPSEIPSASRLDTLRPLFRNVLLAFLATVIVMIALSSIGVDIGPLIASAGIVGIAIGFGAQALVRDVLAGVFFLIDDAFRVGEYIELDANMRGEVENISVRSLQLRHHRGPVITIPFGEMRQITNHNRDWVIYKMMFRMEPETDPQRLKKVVKLVGAEFMEHPVHGPKFIEPLKSQGVYYIDDDSALVIRLKFKCKPRAQFVLRRDIYHRLREVFAEEGFRLARRKVEVVSESGPASDREKAAAEATLAAPQAEGQATG